MADHVRCRYLMPYLTPLNAGQRALNWLAAQVAPAGPAFYTDWTSLDLDRWLNWPASRTLEFLYLDEATKPQRDCHATIAHHLVSATDPVVRYWIITALLELTRVRSSLVAPLARRVQERTGKPLPFLTGAAPAAQPRLVADPQASRIRFTAAEAAPDTVQQATSAIDEIAAAVHAETHAWHDAVAQSWFRA